MFLVLLISKNWHFLTPPPPYKCLRNIWMVPISLIFWMPLNAKVLLAMFAPVNFSIIRTGIRLQLSAFCCSKATLVIDLNFSIWLRARARFDLILALKVCSFSWSNRFIDTFCSCCQKCQKNLYEHIICDWIMILFNPWNYSKCLTKFLFSRQIF